MFIKCNHIDTGATVWLNADCVASVHRLDQPDRWPILETSDVSGWNL